MASGKVQNSRVNRHWSTCHLRLTDMQAMISAHESLEAVIQGLRTTNWAGSQASVAALVPINLWIVDLYNRFEPTWLKWLQAKSEEAAQDAAQDGNDSNENRPPGTANGSEPRE
jgi:hypothetical protein